RLPDRGRDRRGPRRGVADDGDRARHRGLRPRPRVRGDARAAHGPRPRARPPGVRHGSRDGAVGRFVCVSLFAMSPKSTDDDTASLKRLAGRGWQTRDGRFTIETASGTWSVVDEEQTD